jgi:predicted nucleic acid-binding protein
MIALDTNILVYAHREELPLHAEARACIEQLVAHGQRFALPWPCIHEFFSVVTHPRRFRPPSTTEQVFEFLEALDRAESRRLVERGRTASRPTQIFGDLFSRHGATNP